MASQKVTNFRPLPPVDPANERWALIQRVVAGPQFARAPHLRGFLLFVSERLITGRLAEINEYEIGREVLGRRATFNPHEDNIVRVQARHLRAKLEQHFAAEGKDEPVIVAIPRGSYVPVFEPRLVPKPVEEMPAAHPLPAFGRGLRIAAGVVLLLTIFAVLAWFLRSPARAVTLAVGRSHHPMLSRVFRTGEAARIVISDSSFVLLQEVLHRPVSIEEYLSPNYPEGLADSELDTGLQQIVMRDAARQRSSYGDIETAQRIAGVSQQYQTRTLLRHPRHLQVRDFQAGSFVLLGGPLANPWYRLFENRLNFVFEPDFKTGRIQIRNRNPLRGEPAVYSPAGTGETEFAIAALVPNLRGSGQVLLLAGTSVEGAEAAGDLVIREELPAALGQMAVRIRNSEEPVEVLLETHMLAGVPRDSKVIAWRLGEQP